MSNLFVSLHNGARALQAFQDALSVSQNNVNNASTPGFARQRVSFQAEPLSLEEGLPGGVRRGPLEDYRSQYAENQVRRNVSTLGAEDARSSALESIEAEFDISGRSGIAAALNGLTKTFAAWITTPNDTLAREQVIVAARTFSTAVQQTAGSLARIGSGVDGQAQETVRGINQLATQIATYNRNRHRSPEPDPGLDSQLYSDLEQLSEYVDFTTITHEDGTVSVLIGGETPLVAGERAYAISWQDASPGTSGTPAAVLDASGRDITRQISSGKLGGLLGIRNQTIARILGGNGVAGSLNQLAMDVANQVNQTLASGIVTINGSDVAGPPLFTYTSAGAVGAADSLALAPGITAATLASRDPAAGTDNGIAIRLAQLTESFVQQYGSIAAEVGRQSQEAATNQSRANDVTTQARALRSELSGVSLDEEAARLVELQRAYEATARIVSVVDELTQTLLGLLR